MQIFNVLRSTCTIPPHEHRPPAFYSILVKKPPGNFFLHSRKNTFPKQAAPSKTRPNHLAECLSRRRGGFRVSKVPPGPTTQKDAPPITAGVTPKLYGRSQHPHFHTASLQSLDLGQAGAHEEILPYTGLFAIVRKRHLRCSS